MRRKRSFLPCRTGKEYFLLPESSAGRRRDRTFGYAAYLDRLRAGTEI